MRTLYVNQPNAISPSIRVQPGCTVLDVRYFIKILSSISRKLQGHPRPHVIVPNKNPRVVFYPSSIESNIVSYHLYDNKAIFKAAIYRPWGMIRSTWWRMDCRTVTIPWSLVVYPQFHLLLLQGRWSWWLSRAATACPFLWIPRRTNPCQFAPDVRNSLLGQFFPVVNKNKIYCSGVSQILHCNRDVAGIGFSRIWHCD